MAVNKLQLKRSAVAGKEPTTSSLALGELAINTYEGKVFLKKDDGVETIVQLADVSGSIFSASYAQTSSHSDQFTVTGPINVYGSQYISGSLVVGNDITARRLVVQTITSSVIYSSGSNVFGDATSDTQTFTGSVNISGSLNLVGNQNINAGYELDVDSINVNTITDRNGGTLTLGASTSSVSGFLTVNNSISASGKIEAVSFTGSFSGSLDNLRGTATHIPYFSSSQVLANSAIYQVSSASIAINQDNVTSAAPEALYVYQSSPTSYNVISGKGNLDNYLQLNIQNTNQGVSASSDVVATANNGNENSNYINMGINSENFNGPIGDANDAYLYSTGQNLHIGNTTPGKHLGFFVGGGEHETDKKFQLNPNNQHIMSGSLDVSGSITATSFITRGATAAQFVKGDGSLDSTLYTSASVFNAETSSFNAYSSSMNAFSASILSTTASINSFSSSVLNFTASTLVNSASFDTRIKYISSSFEAATASLNAFSSSMLSTTASLNAFSASMLSFTASQKNSNGTFATTGSNIFIGNQTITGSLSVSGSTNIYGTTNLTGSVNVSGSTGTSITANVDTIVFTGSYSQSGNVTLSGSVDISGSLTVQGRNYINDSSSFDTRINYLSSSFNSNTASINAFTASINAFSASMLTTTASMNAFSSSVLNFTASTLVNSASFDTRINYVSSSFEAATASLNLFSASILSYTASNNEVVAKLYAETSSLLANTASMNLFSASVLNFTASTLINSASFDTRINYLSSSFEANSASINLFTASFNAFSSSILNTTASINAFSASMLSFTASQKDLNGTLATTGSNIFIGNQVISGSTSMTGSLSLTGSQNIIGNLTVTDTITAERLIVQFITSSVAQVTGSTKFGDEVTDTHQFTGSVLVSGSLVVNGRDYITDSGSFDKRINYISSSFEAATASLNLFSASILSYTASNNEFVADMLLETASLQAATASLYNFSSSILSYTASNNEVVAKLYAETASLNAFSASVLNFTASTLVNSASFDTRINYISSSFESTSASINAFSASILSYTASNNLFVADMLLETASLQAATASLNLFSASILSYTASNNEFVADILLETASLQAFSASMLNFTASTLIDSASFDTRINYVSTSFEAHTASFNNFSSSILSTTASINNFSSSVLNFTASTLVNSASFDTRIGYISSSFEAATASLNAFSASILSYTASNNATIADILVETASLQAATASLNLFSASMLSFTASQKNSNGTFATTGSNTFIGNQTVTGSLIVTNGITGSLLGTASFAVSSSYAAIASIAAESRDIILPVKNVSGVQINKGSVVRISGATGDNALISLADWTNDDRSANTIGLVTTNIPNDSFGFVMTEGTFLGFDTSTPGWVAGQLLYLGTSGSITGSAPQAPLHGVRLGQVLRVQQNNGSIYVRIDNGYEIGELHDVRDSSTTSSYGDLLVKSGNVWVNSKQLTGSYELTGSLQATSLNATSFTASNATIGGNLVVNGTASFNYVETISGSAVIIGQEYIILNTQSPAARFAGLKIYDSGSTNATASIVWDSERNHLVYQNASGSSYSGGGFMSGPRNTGSLGDETYPSFNRILRGQGGDHLYDSNISDNNTTVSIFIDTAVTGSLNVTNGITGSLLGNVVGNLTGTASYASNSNLLDGLDSTSFTSTGSFEAQTASFNAFSASILNYTASNNITIAALYAETASLKAATASLNEFSASILSYTASAIIDSGSVSTRLVSLEAFSSSLDSTYATDADLNALSASFTAHTASINAFSASINNYTASVNSTIAALYAETASISSYTASTNATIADILVETASLQAFSASILNYTASNNDTVSSLYAFTSSILNYTASNNTTIAAIYAETASIQLHTASINAFSASVLNYTASNNDAISSLYLATASLNSFSASILSYTASNNEAIASIYNTTASLSSSIAILSGSFLSASSSFDTRINNLTESVFTHVVTNNGASNYIIDGVAKPMLSFVPGATYRFNTTAVEGSHPFKFSTSPNGPTQYTTGVTSGSNYIQIEVNYDTPTPLYYYCTIHSGMGNEINVLRIENLVTTASFNNFSSSIQSFSASVLSYTASQNDRNGTYATTGSNIFEGVQTINSNLVVTGSITAQTLVVQTITSSVDFVTGSTHFGTILENTHQFTGSVSVSGSLAVNDSNVILTNQTASMSVATASYWSGSINNVLSASYALTASHATNVPETASFANNATSASYALTASFALNVPLTSSFALTASYWSGSIINAQTASYVVLAQSASYWSGSIQNAVSAAFADLATSASFASTASFALNGGGGGLSALYIQDEGITQGTASFLDFVGAGVTATVTNGTASITISGGGSGTAVQGASVQFTQPTAATTWSINHAINSRTPVVEVYDSNYNVIIPTGIQNPAPYQTNIFFEIAQSGHAIISTGGVLSVSGSNAILNQNVSSSTWTFNHELNNLYPVFTIFDSNDDVIIPQRIHVVDTGSAVIYFSSPRTGTAVASVAGNQTFALSSSLAATASLALTAISSSYATTASFVTLAQTASYWSGSINNVLSASYAATASYADNLTVAGTLTAQTIVVQTITSSVDFVTGSTRFGSLSSNTHVFTGSVIITGSLDTTSATASFGLIGSSLQPAAAGVYSIGDFNSEWDKAYINTVYGNLNGTASFANNATSASFATDASQASSATSASYALTASFALNGGGGGISAISIADEGILLGSASYFDFTGAGVSTIVNAGTASFTITGGGGGGTQGLTTTFTQSSAAVSWSFTHNLNTRTPVVQVYDSGYNQITPQSISSSNANEVVIGFGVATTGYAVISTGGALVVTGSNVILNQTASATTWSFNHGLNQQYPVFQVFNTDDEVIIPEKIKAVDSASALIYFPTPVAGKAIASFAGLSGSIGGGSGAGFPFSGSAVITGSFLVSGSSVDFTQVSSFTGNLTGTASYATFALTASTAPGYTVQFSQTASAATWSFTHNMGTRNPIVQVYGSDYKQLIPNDIVGIDGSTVEVRFDYAATGYAILSNGGGLYITGSTSTLIQTSAATTWSFNHQLNTKYPAFEIYDENDLVIIPAGIKAIDTDNAEIYFAGAQAGRVIANFSGINGLQDNAVSASYASSGSVFHVDKVVMDRSLMDYAQVNSSIVGSNNMFTQATGSYTAAFFKYTAASGSNARAGEVTAVWNAGTTEFMDVSTNDIGNTNAVTASVAIVSGEAQLNFQTNTSGWRIKSTATFM